MFHKIKKNCLINNLTNDTTYLFTVKAIDSNGKKSTGVSITGTPTEEEIPAPNDISNLTALNQGAAILLSWTEDFTNQNIYGIEISYKQNTTGRSIYTEQLSYNTIIVPQNQKNCLINNLTNDTTYLFTVKVINTNGKKSEGVSITATPEPFPLRIELSVPEEYSRDQTTITAKITRSSEINKVVSKKGEILNPAVLLNDENLSTYSLKEDNTYSLTVNENGFYTFAASDITGRQTAVSINVKIDNTPPDEVSNASLQYDRSQNTLVLTWEDPEDSTEEYNSPYDYVLIFYNSDCYDYLLGYSYLYYIESTSDSNFIYGNYKYITVPKGQETATISDIDSTKSFNQIVIKTVDRAGNMSRGTELLCNTYLYSATKDTAVDLINHFAESNINDIALNITGEITPDFITELTNAIKQNQLRLSILNLKNTTGESGIDQTYDYNNFDHINIGEIILPAGLQRIGVGYFQCSYLRKLTIPDTVTVIGDWAFNLCSILQSIVIPDSVTEIGSYAFCHSQDRCYDLELSIPDSVISIGHYAFDKITINHLPQNIEVINEYAFNQCHFPNNELILLDSIKRIERRAFSRSSVSSIKLPNSLTYIGTGAFSGINNLKQVILPDKPRTYYKGHYENGTPIYDNEIISDLSFSNYENNARVFKNILENDGFIYTDEVDKNIDISY